MFFFFKLLLLMWREREACFLAKGLFDFGIVLDLL